MSSGIKKLLPLITIALLSCVSFKPVYLDLSSMDLEGSGQGAITEFRQAEKGLLLTDKENKKDIAINFKGEIPPEIMEGLKGATSYVFRSRIRPDGPIESLILSDGNGLKSYLGDGLRRGILPGLTLEIFPVSNSDSISFSSSEETWTVKAGKPSVILIGGVPFIVHILNIQRGNPEFDQPSFKTDLILIRK